MLEGAAEMIPEGDGSVEAIDVEELTAKLKFVVRLTPPSVPVTVIV